MREPAREEVAAEMFTNLSCFVFVTYRAASLTGGKSATYLDAFFICQLICAIIINQKFLKKVHHVRPASIEIIETLSLSLT